VAERCEITDLLADQCGHCNGAEKRAAEAERETFRRTAGRGACGPWFTAQYAGMCKGCSEDIEPGDTIRADGDGRYLCADCGDAA
jgi:hypothetical protein